MRKWILTVLAVMLLVSPCWAGHATREIIAETALTKSVSEATVTLYTADTQNMTFFVDYTPLNNESLTVTFDVSYDGTNWMDAKFKDYTGGDTLQTSESLTADAWYYTYWLNELSVPYVRIHMIGATWAAGSSATVTVYINEQK